MKRSKYDAVISLTRHRSFQLLFTVAVFYILMVTLAVPFVFNSRTTTTYLSVDTLTQLSGLEISQDFHARNAPSRPFDSVYDKNPTQSQLGSPKSSRKPNKILSTLRYDPITFDPTKKDGSVELHRRVKAAWEEGKKLWVDIELGKVSVLNERNHTEPKNRTESCPHSLFFSGSEILKAGQAVKIPCGMTLGSHITVVGKPRGARVESEPKIALVRDGEEEEVMVSQFMLELQGLKTADGEDPPRILHFNPRLRGDWSGKPVIEMNTCYRMHWGIALRCDGWRSEADDDTVDGQVKCEKWIRDADDRLEESKASWWMNRLIGRTEMAKFDWPYPFAEDKLFVLTLSAGLEGYHVNVDGRHVTSFPYHTGFILEDAAGLTVNGDVDVHSVFVASLPTTHPIFAPQRLLEMSPEWRTPPLPKGPVELLIGVLSAGSHFAERMAVRKSWMQHKLLNSSNVVARFFVAFDARKEVNLELKKEAEYFGDIVIAPYMDNYDLVVLKTVAICEYGVRTARARYIMKGDDDTFVRVDAVLNETKKVGEGKSLYMGNINYYHKPMRYGKWAVTYEEWPGEDYPPYANGPGYILSNDIARFVVSEFERHKLRLFKMEDVSMGMWVEKFSSSKPVEYVHSLKYYQLGCIEGYITAHYQSPRQMICLWDKLQTLGKPRCCNMR